MRSLPNLTARLPAEEALPALRGALASARRAVFVAPPGSGKTTRVPPALLESPPPGMDLGPSRRILLLEPRRLAARAAARRMASLRSERVGETVGLTTRLAREVSDRTEIEIVTEGILARRLASDPSLPGVGLVVFDEFHERSLEADLGLALLLDAAAHRRPDLGVLVMSATIQAEPIAELLAGDGGAAPIIRAGGRVHPVEVRYLDRPAEGRIEEATAVAVRHALRRERGDILVFLPGAGEIRRTAELLAGAEARVHPLYGDLDRAAQDAAILPDPFGGRRIVLATNIAETSITIEGVRVVVDAGWRRVARFDPASGLPRLETVRVTKDAADQRTGRAGRTEPGVSYRLWTRGEEAGFLARRSPEILDADLAGLALDTADWGTRAEDLRWCDPPPAASLSAGRATLVDLGCLDAEGRITPLGRAAAGLPFHPRLAVMLHRARDFGWTDLACEAAAILEERDPLRGAETADLGTRLGTRDPAIRRAADRARRALGRAKTGVPEPDDALGILVAFAYPDRVARRRSGASGRYLLANGRGACLGEGDRLARREFLAAAEVEGGGAEGRIRLAAPITRESILRFFPERLPRIERVVRPEKALAVDETERARRARMAWLAARGRTDLSEAPEAIPVPSGRRLPLRYTPGEPPALEVRIQEIFGLLESPRVGGEPIVLHLLSPARRPVQVTRDLASFWAKTYPEIRRELSRKYPRHEWPEDPTTARPTARPKPRGKR